ncbi:MULTISPECIES: YncE family protein [unclassified Nocardioides]|uniref:YncE family protein n=1 Tax=unclassified Nocardioides TaxID=2615069 RepID=UPI0000571BD4|nr:MULTISPECIES: YncE family protein [unclassified Nocardioides]ABL81049.1 putative surface antigen protein [Nocardioides sp. JS614]
MRAPRRRTRLIGLAVVALLVTLAGGGLAIWWKQRGPSTLDLPITQARVIPLTGDSSRFDYEDLDAERGLLFIAHMGAGQVIEVDVRTGKVVRTIDGLDDVHGVIVVPQLQRVFATATGTNELVSLDEDTGRERGRAPTDAYPDGLAYNPDTNTVWTTNEDAGTETVVDAKTLDVRGSVELGDSVGNVAYDPGSHTMMVGVQSDNVLAVIDPSTLRVERRVDLPGCDTSHSLRIDAVRRLAFVGCEDNDRLLTLDLNSWMITGNEEVGDFPDVLSYDQADGRLWGAAESGWVTILELDGRAIQVVGRDFLTDGAHVVAVDPTNHHAYLPVPDGGDRQPAVLDEAPDGG